MVTEQLEPRKDTPICIETPLGIIEILRSRVRRKGLVIRLPDGMKAYLGRERTLENARFVQETNGRVVAKYTVLVALKGEDGSLVGVRSQTVVRLADSPISQQPVRLQA